MKILIVSLHSLAQNPGGGGQGGALPRITHIPNSIRLLWQLGT